VLLALGAGTVLKQSGAQSSRKDPWAAYPTVASANPLDAMPDVQSEAERDNLRYERQVYECILRNSNRVRDTFALDQMCRRFPDIR
jgi:hypothetical protein